MTHRKAVIAALTACLLLGGCAQPTRQNPGGNVTKAAPAPARTPNNAAGADLADPVPGQQPPPPPADPGPYNDIHQAVVRVWWTGERSGTVTINLNATPVVDRAPAGRSSMGADGKYHGGYVYVIPAVQPGTRIWVQFKANMQPPWMMVAIYHNGKTIAANEAGEPGCLKDTCGTNAVIR